MTSSDHPKPFPADLPGDGLEPAPPSAPGTPRGFGRRWRSAVFPGRRKAFPQQPSLGVGPQAPDGSSGPGRAARHVHEESSSAAPDSLGPFVALLSPSGVLLDGLPAPAGPVEWLAVDAVGRQLWEAPWWSWSPDVQDRLRTAVRRAGAGEVVSYGDTVRVRGNMLVTVGLTVAPVHSPDGITGIRCSVLDPDEAEPRGTPRHLAPPDAGLTGSSTRSGDPMGTPRSTRSPAAGRPSS